MKLSEQTIKILKNFAGINQSILIRAGSLLSTRSIAGDIVADATIDEQFSVKFALYDLQVFLNTLKLFSSPVLDFSHAEDNFLYICEEDDLNFKVRYTFTEERHIVFPINRPDIDSFDISFMMDRNCLDSISKASSVMQLPYVIVKPSENVGMIKIEVSDIKDKSSNKFSIDIEGESPENADFNLVFKMESMKFIPNDYNVSIAGNKIALFESDVADYYVGLDAIHSKFN